MPTAIADRASGKNLYRGGMRQSPRPLASIVLLAALLVVAVIVPAAVAGQSSSPPIPVASAGPVELEPVIEEAYGLRSVAPAGWTSAGMGIRTRGASSDDRTLLALQSAPLAADALWPSLLPQLGLTERPERTERRSTAAGLDWDLYSVPMGPTTADLGLAEGPGVTYLALLVSAAAERDALVETVFLPAVDALEPLMVERTPLPSGIGYSEVEVSFPGGGSDVTLAGTLTVPAGEGPHPAVVLMSGSGPQDRDESLPGMTLKPFALIADALGKAGVAVLRFDDRGTASSTGDHASATIVDLTADGAAALAYLRSRPEVDSARAGILGHSEGGAYIARIAAEDPDVPFVVGLAPMVRSGTDLLIDQNIALARSQGASEDRIEALRAYVAALYPLVIEDDMAAAEALMRDFHGELWDSLDPADQASAGEREAFIDAQVAPQLATMDTAWFRSLLTTDPSVDWARVDAPVLGVFGGKDVQVIAGPESAALEAALGDRDPRSRVEIIADANHLFQHAVTGGLGEYPTLEQTFTPTLLPLLTDWVREVTGLDG